MAKKTPIDDVLEWSASLSPWRQDALRRLASAPKLSQADDDELFAIVQKQAGFKLPKEPPEPVPLTKAHFAVSGGSTPLQLKAIRAIQNVNALGPKGVEFEPAGLTIVYGLNGSGKSGFSRILRTACRTRIEDPKKLKVLANVYGAAAAVPQEAEIVIDAGAGDETLNWKATAPALEKLLSVGVFDSAAAQLYVDAGNQIRFLPFGLDLAYRLNEVCLALKERFSKSNSAVAEKLQLAAIRFTQARPTAAQKFYGELRGGTTDKEIDAAASFTQDKEARREELSRLLATGSTATVDLNALAIWCDDVAKQGDATADALSVSELKKYVKLRRDAADARAAASVGADKLFVNEPLPGVGGETWRRLWIAAREFSVTDAYPGKSYPVTLDGDEAAACVLCHQPLDKVASQRLKRFAEYVDGALAASASTAESAVAEALEALPSLAFLDEKTWNPRVAQITARDAALGAALGEFRTAATVRLTKAKEILLADPPLDEAGVPEGPLVASSDKLAGLANTIREEMKAIADAETEENKAKLRLELAELEDRKVLAAGKATLTTRRDLYKELDWHNAALAEIQTTTITKKANSLVDTHLTGAVQDQFDAERKELQIDHLKVGLTRKTDQTRASFTPATGAKIAAQVSEILSEGEQRALALAGFFTEVTLTKGSGPIVVDDPVSSLDRQRSKRVAKRLAKEAGKRQVVVFTHDLIFFNELAGEADALGLNPRSVTIFNGQGSTGLVDPAGAPWMGLRVNKRIARLRQDFPVVRKHHNVSPTEYEIGMKNLYRNLRDTYERAVEECIFHDVVRRGTERIETLKLRNVRLSDALAVRFHEGMTKANTYSHDNSASGAVTIPEPDEFKKDLDAFEALIADLAAEAKDAEAARPSMKKK